MGFTMRAPSLLFLLLVSCGVIYTMAGAFADTTVSDAWEIGSSTTDTLYVWDYGTMVTMSPVWSP
jgi:hypothetical protein